MVNRQHFAIELVELLHAILPRYMLFISIYFIPSSCVQLIHICSEILGVSAVKFCVSLQTLEI